MAEVKVEDKLKRLYALQEVDTRIDEIQILKGELPIEVSDLEDELVGLETRMNKLKDAVKEVEDEISKHKANIKEAETLQKRYKKQLDDVKNNREYDALSKEIELQSLEIQLSEKKINDAQTIADARGETLKEAKSQYNAKKKDLEAKKVELEKIIEKTEKEERKYKRQSTMARKEVDDRLLAAYDKVRSAYRNGLAVVPVLRDACGGCFNKIPPQMQLEIQMRRKIIACEHCGRILVDPELAGITEDAEVS
ncbi:MAG: C4-type zinc ribbon domain-containing protein [Saprospiraceae bacterium]|nr:C4-type zinc ribbon domain-containing protein [Saprospiraceae bacterium]